jgi:uncharacterized lipoprotein YbaY
MRDAVVTGEIVFPRPPPPLGAATVYVRLLDTSLADAPARILAEEVLTGLGDQAASGGTLPFTLHGQVADPTSRLTVSVHVDLDGDGVISRGDYINRASIPVLTHNHPRQVRVPVQEVT